MANQLVLIRGERSECTIYIPVDGPKGGRSFVPDPASKNHQIRIRSPVRKSEKYDSISVDKNILVRIRIL